MKTVIGIYLIVHGFAHLGVFLKQWRITGKRDEEFKTTIYPGNIDIGELGMRISGLLWLLMAIALVWAGYDILTGMTEFCGYVLILTTLSLIICITGWPETRFGMFANIIMMLFLFLCFYYSWSL